MSMNRTRGGRMSNQDLDELRSKAAAHDPRVPLSDDRLKPRAVANTRKNKPMTSVYHSKSADPQREDGDGSFPSDRRARPSKKTLASIEYEKQFATFDSLDMKRAAASSKAISAAAKSVLQDEYVTRPREVSVIPQSLASAQSAAARSDPRPAGKLMPAAPAIQQVFLC